MIMSWNSLCRACVLLCVLLPMRPAAQVPPTARQPVVDTYFGMQVTDNYRWLEDMNAQPVQDWFRAQHDYSEGVLDRIPGRDSLVQTLLYYNSLKAATYTNITRKAGLYFYKKTLPDEVVGKLYCRAGLTGEETLLFDAGKDNEGQPQTIAYFVPSEDGRTIAFGISSVGAEVATIHVMDVASRTLYPERIYPSWFGISAWSPDNKGFMYTAQITGDETSPDFLLDTRSMYHRVATDASQDLVLFSREKYPDLGAVREDLCFVVYSQDFRYLQAFLSGVGNDVNCFYAGTDELLNPAINWKRLFKTEDNITAFVDYGDDIFALTYAGASNYRVIKVSLPDVNVSTAETIIPEGPDKVDNLIRCKDYLLCTTSNGINSRLLQYSFAEGSIEEVALPFSGSAYAQTYDFTSNDGLLYLTSWTKPTTLFDYDASSGSMVESAFSSVPAYPGVDDLVVEELEVPSHDGALVPLSLIYRKDVKRDGSAVCFITGYGAYGSSNTPGFGVRSLALLNRGVIVAETHPRGGSEKGEGWYKAGYKLTKPNTWKDFIACAEYVISSKYTSPEHLIGEGTSAGGILIGRAITERPDLFAAAINNVGCSNALRFENTPNGPNNAREFGTVKDSAECMGLYEMDALHHVKEGTAYPAVICVGGMNDPRVLAWQPAKFAAALQSASTSGKPVLLKVNYESGHFTEDKLVTYRNFASMYAFALWQAGHPDFQPK